MCSLSDDRLEDLQNLVRDWLRHAGRTQADLRRALGASSIRMPVLLEELLRIQAHQGLPALAELLCGIEEQWRSEQEQGAGDGDADPAHAAQLDSFNQLDLLLEEIRQGG